MASEINTIRRKACNDAEVTYYPILIIGAGESGIAMGCRLKQVLGFDQFRILERRAGIGGVWYTNRYPGVAGDIPALCYSYSFAQKPDWTHLHPPGAEILEYLQQTCKRFQIENNIRLNTDVSGVKWIEADEEWEVTISTMTEGSGDLTCAQRQQKIDDGEVIVVNTEVVRARIVISAVGALVEPKALPEIPGMDTFQGQIVHSAKWDPNVDVRDKNIIVVGTGSSAGQIVPALIRPENGARSVTQLMRTPPWVEPTMTPDGMKSWEKWMPRLCGNVPGFQRVMRKIVFTSMEVEFLKVFSASDKARKNRESRAEELLKYLHEMVPQKYHEILTPNYEVFCKRRVIDAGWFASLQDDRIHLSTQPITKINAKSVIIGPGRSYPPETDATSRAPVEARKVAADIIIFANGYDAGVWLHPLDIQGLQGRSLHSVWQERGGPQAYLGSVMDGFPNFFIIHGPNTVTGHSSVILASEMMIQYAMHFIRPLLNGEMRTCEIKEEAEKKWTQDIQAQLQKSVWMSGGCNSWYTRDGWNSTVYPRSQIDFAWRCKNPQYGDWHATYSSKGLRKYRTRLGLWMPDAAPVRPHAQEAITQSSQEMSESVGSTAIQQEAITQSSQEVSESVGSTATQQSSINNNWLAGWTAPPSPEMQEIWRTESSSQSLWSGARTPELEYDTSEDGGSTSSPGWPTPMAVENPAIYELNGEGKTFGSVGPVPFVVYGYFDDMSAAFNAIEGLRQESKAHRSMPGAWPTRAGSVAYSSVAA